MIQVKNISMSYGAKQVLDQVSFNMDRGEITALVGRNGSGKTTLLNILARVLRADEGEVSLNKELIDERPQLQADIAYLPDQFDFFKFENIKRTVDYYQVVYPDFDHEFAYRELGLHDIAPQTSIRTLSKGNTTLAGLIITLATNANYILLDEVLDGMDILNKETIIRYLIDASAEGRGILISSHELKELEGIASRILYLSMAGQLEEMVAGENIHLKKYQLVTKADLPKAIKDQAIVRFSIGRVHTILVEGSHEYWHELFLKYQIVQYDILPVQLEDFFYWEQGKKGDSHE